MAGPESGVELAVFLAVGVVEGVVEIFEEALVTGLFLFALLPAAEIVCFTCLRIRS